VPELVQSERLQPSLLSRLTDNDPAKSAESLAQRVLSAQRLREDVIDNLLSLLATTNLAAVSAEVSEFPEAARSVVNYGIPDLAGTTASSIDAAGLARSVREAVMVFEPRLSRSSLQVRAIVSGEKMAHNTLVFEIEGELWADPTPLRLFLQTQVDLETGNVAIVPGGRGAG
jgi:type VI secretion system protein ImpF